MTKKLILHGNSAVLEIEKPILELLHIDMDTELEVVTDGKSIIISPLRSETSETGLLRSLARVNEQHRDTLQKLAH